jgi:oxygen-independent coproporphyrinogen-3 oxidase
VEQPGVGVYLHVPFCERVCPYCDFAVVGVRRLPGEHERRYVDALCRELERRRGAFAGRRLASLYLGGGTPSLLRPEAVARLVEAVRAAFPSGQEPEITLEVNPGSLERERLPGFRAAGVNRVSVGVQSFQDLTLKRLGRAHRGDEARRTLAAARQAGFPVLCLDLMLAAPDQDLAALEADLEEVVGHAPEHVSVYELTLEPGTPFAAAASRGRLALPDEDAALSMLESAEARLVGAGYERYEISNYARPGFAAVHNRRYWERRPVLGLGVGAVSNDPPSPAAPHGTRRTNTRSLEAYLEALEAGRSAEREPAERLSARTARGEAVFLALRSARGLDARRFADEFGGPPRAFWAGAIEELLGEGLLAEQDPGDLRLTARGRLLADAVFQHFV